MLYGTNGYAYSGCPAALAERLKKLHDEEQYIDDVVLTERGKWLIQYGKNGCYYSSSIPQNLKSKIRQFNNDDETILTIAFNDLGDWVVVTTEHFVASSDAIQNALKQWNEEYGMLWTVCITNDCLVAVYEEGIGFIGDIPSDLEDALNRTTLNVYRLKIAGKAWFFADQDGYYQYSM